MTGTFADGLGNVRKVPDRVDFDSFPWQSFAVWIMTQMQRLGQIRGDVDKAVASKVFLATEAAKFMTEDGLTPPATTSKTFVAMGQTFDPDKPEDDLDAFEIRQRHSPVVRPGLSAADAEAIAAVASAAKRA